MTLLDTRPPRSRRPRRRPVTWQDGTISTPEAARLFDVAPVTIWRWYHQLAEIDGRPVGIGHGGRYRITRADMLAFQALHVADLSFGQGDDGTRTHAIRRRVTRAILTRPGRWLVITESDAHAFEEIEDAARWILAARPLTARVLGIPEGPEPAEAAP